MDGSSDDATDIWADSYILMCLGAFDAAAEARLRTTLEGAPPELTPARWRKSVESELSLAAELPGAVVALWEEQRRANPLLTPERFAQENRETIFHDILYF